MNTPPNTSVISSPQPLLSPPKRRCGSSPQYGARMNSPRPWSYHQKAIAVATSSARSALAMRLRSSVRCATRVIVASASRGGRRRRTRGRRPGSVTVVLPGTVASAGAVGRAGLVRPGAELGGADLGDPGLLVQLRGQVVGRGGGARRRRGRGRHDLAAHGGRLGGVLRAEPTGR